MLQRCERDALLCSSGCCSCCFIDTGIVVLSTVLSVHYCSSSSKPQRHADTASINFGEAADDAIALLLLHAVVVISWRSFDACHLEPAFTAAVVPAADAFAVSSAHSASASAATSASASASASAASAASA